MSAGAYRTPALKRGIAWLKFKSVRPVAAVLAGLMLPALEQIRPLLQLPAEAVLVPLPLHQHRLAQRGFNQAEALTTALHQLTGIPVIPALTRQRPTIQQTQLPSSLRRHNIAHAFLSSFQIPNSQYQIALIIDDVTTTGATLAEAARTLREAGFTGTIYGATVARG